MLVLTIETATPVESVALVDSGDVLGTRTSDAGRGRADELLARVDELLGASSVSLSDVGALAVSIGPGRFTGLRVGLATAKGLAASTGLPVAPVNTLEALALSAASGAQGGAELVAPMLDARRGEVYGALFATGPAEVGEDIVDAVRRLDRDRACPPESFAESALARAGGARVLFAGTGASLYRELVEAASGGVAVFAGEAVERPLPAAMAALAERALSSGVGDAAALRPIYLRGI